jgi:hypothetical protein
MDQDFSVPPVAATDFEIPSMGVNWLAPSRVYDTTPQYPQVQLAPTNSGYDNLKVRSAFRMDSDSRRNFASLKNLAGFTRLGDVTSGAPQITQTEIAVVGALSAASIGACAYHGYKRHRGSVPWAIGWAIMGGLFPVVSVAVAFAEGFGKPMKR